MNSGKRWWWRIALAATAAATLTIPLSFHWIAGWGDSHGRWYVYIEHGVLHGNNLGMPGTAPPKGPWYGSFQVYRSGIYDPWVPFPIFRRRPGGLYDFKLPVHFAFLILLPVVIYPVLPPVVRRQRRKRGLCVHCAYDLTGNESGICPECGTAR